MAADELIFDPGVLKDEALCEFQGYGAAERHGGVAILPWRAAWLEATAAGVAALGSAPSRDEGSFRQGLVHLQKSRAATWRDLGHAWQLIEPGGRLLVCGGNELGIRSAVKRLNRELGQEARVLANRRHARIVAFERTESSAPEAAPASQIVLSPPGGDRQALHAEPGVFSAKRLDVGTQLLLEALAEQPPARRVLDLGCGIGPLGLSALLRWPDARALLLDGDLRAVASGTRNADSLGVASRSRVEWWDAEEACPEDDFDLALVNPPFHGGKEVDLRPARAMFTRLTEALSRGGRALIVANRTLPYEHSLSAAGSMEILRAERGYKIIGFTRGRASTTPGSGRSRGGRSHSKSR
jgi:16S rRNA (guanine1207-N2)-methyltransferase